MLYQKWGWGLYIKPRIFVPISKKFQLGREVCDFPTVGSRLHLVRVTVRLIMKSVVPKFNIRRWKFFYTREGSWMADEAAWTWWRSGLYTVIFDLWQSICKRCAFFACSLAFIFIFNLSTCDLDLIHVEAIPPIKVTAIYTVILRADVRITALPLNIPKLTRDC